MTDLFAGIGAASSALSAQRLRMTVAAENLANAGNTKRLENGLPYQRQKVSFQAVLDQQGEQSGRVTAKVFDSPRYTARYEPGHPDADADGKVLEADIDSVLELTDLMTASKAYEANVNSVRGLMRMHEQALRLGDIA